MNTHNTDFYPTLTVILQSAEVTILFVSAVFVYRQIRIAAKSSQFEAMQRIAEYMGQIDGSLYEIPADIVYRAEEFPDHPPPRYARWNPTAGEVDKMTVAKGKRSGFFKTGGGYAEYEAAARKTINALNDIAQYLEDGYASYADVLGQYHFKIIRVIHIVEAFRNQRSGDYGHRLLRLRQKAVQYHYMHPKHSDQDVVLQLKGGTKIVLLQRMQQTREAAKFRRKYRKEFWKNGA
ncbi:MAG: hypothetical protein LBQ15_12040 [Clostridium sp.]|nr:hypothetical protein [Clostridium sp.]